MWSRIGRPSGRDGQIVFKHDCYEDLEAITTEPRNVLEQPSRHARGVVSSLFWLEEKGLPNSWFEGLQCLTSVQIEVARIRLPPSLLTALRLLFEGKLVRHSGGRVSHEALVILEVLGSLTIAANSHMRFDLTGVSSGVRSSPEPDGTVQTIDRLIDGSASHHRSI